MYSSINMELFNKSLDLATENQLETSSQLFDYNQNDSIMFVSTQSLNNLHKLSHLKENSRAVKKAKSHYFNNHSLSSSSASVNSLANFDEPTGNLRKMQPTKTSTPVILRNLISKKSEIERLSPVTTKKIDFLYIKNTSHKKSISTKSVKEIENKFKPNEVRNDRLTLFEAALIQQKTLLKKTCVNFKKYVASTDPLRYSNKQPKKLSSDYYFFNGPKYTRRECLDSDQTTSNGLIVSRQSGTIRGNLNHVKNTVRNVFAKESHITSPIANAQLNNVSINSLHEACNYDIDSDSIDQSAYIEVKNLKKPNENNALAVSLSHFILFDLIFILFNINLFPKRNYEEEERQKIVIYTTSLQIGLNFLKLLFN